MPGEEGYPPTWRPALADFYERGGRCICLGDGRAGRLGDGHRRGRQPPGRRLLRAGDAGLDADRRGLLGARRRPRPPPPLPGDQLEPQLQPLRRAPRRVVPRERGRRLARPARGGDDAAAEGDRAAGGRPAGRLDALPDASGWCSRSARAIREDFLQQNAFHDVDCYCPLAKQHGMLSALLHFYEVAREALEKGTTLAAMPRVTRLRGGARGRTRRKTPRRIDVAEAARARRRSRTIDAAFDGRSS